jgi:predicted exporter
MAGTIATSAPKLVKRNSKFSVSGKVTPSYAGVTVIIERKNSNGVWKKIASVKTDAAGKWAVNRSAGANKLTVAYRAKLRDARLGVLVSNTKTTKVN